MKTITLNNGVEMPALGLGVFQTPPDETRDAVRSALDAGYRHIDTAAAYGNERQVGEPYTARAWDRSQVFLETRIWISDHGYDETLHGFEKSARKLDVEQIDLLILHQALPSAFDRTLEAYRALETLLTDGKVRAIGSGARYRRTENGDSGDQGLGLAGDETRDGSQQERGRSSRPPPAPCSPARPRRNIASHREPALGREFREPKP